MMKHLKDLSIIKNFLKFVFFIITITNCVAQNNRGTLLNDEINTILNNVDSLDEYKNFHIVLIAQDSNKFFVSVRANDCLGETLFEKVELSICRFYQFRNHYVYIYEYEPCNYQIPEQFMRKESKLPYNYLEESPFFSKSGIIKEFEVQRNGSSLKYIEKRGDFKFEGDSINF